MILCDILFVFPGYVTIRRQQFHQSIPGRFRICLALVVTLQNESPKQQEHYIHSGKESWSTPSDTSSWGSQSRGGKQQSWTKTPSAEQHAEETQKPLRARLLRVKADPMNYPVRGILQARILECLSLLQGIFPTQGWNPGLPHCKRILHQLSHQLQGNG